MVSQEELPFWAFNKVNVSHCDLRECPFGTGCVFMAFRGGTLCSFLLMSVEDIVPVLVLLRKPG